MKIIQYLLNILKLKMNFLMKSNKIVSLGYLTSVARSNTIKQSLFASKLVKKTFPGNTIGSTHLFNFHFYLFLII